MSDSQEKPVIYVGAKSNPDTGKKAFKEGEVISGTFFKRTEKPGMNDRPMITYFLENDEAVWGLNACGDLDQRFKEQGIEEGSAVKVELVKVKTTSNGYPFRNFNVVAA